MTNYYEVGDIDPRPAPSPAIKLRPQTWRLFQQVTQASSLSPEIIYTHLVELSRRVDALESRPSTRAEPQGEPANFVPLDKETQHHDMAVGPCKCGAWHTPPDPTMRERAEKIAERMIWVDEKAVKFSSYLRGGFSSTGYFNWLQEKPANSASLTADGRGLITDALIAFASAEMEKMKVEPAAERIARLNNVVELRRRDEKIDHCERRINTLTAERDELKGALDRAGLTTPSPIRTPPPTQGDEGFEEWVRNRWRQLCDDQYTLKCAIALAREAHHRATNAERQRCAKVANDYGKSATANKQHEKFWAAQGIESAILTPSEQSK